MEIQQNYCLKHLNTFGINASTRYYAEVGSVEEIREVLEDITGIPMLILGGGSNVLLTKDFEGITLKVAFSGKRLIKEDNDFIYVQAGAGENWHQFVLYCIENNYAGVENLSLIPGNVGAAPMQNIGAYGVELKDVFHELEAFHLPTGETHSFSKEECAFGYRESVFKNIFKGQYIILNVTLKLFKKPRLNTSYGAIEAELAKRNIKDPTIRDISNAVISIRQSKLPDPAEIGNAGSFFKNPVIGIEELRSLQERFPDIVNYPVSSTHVKIAAGWLIEKSGWKGKTFGNYGVHKKQALVLVNYKDATGDEVYKLSQKILDSVKDTFGVLLEREVNVV